MSDVREIADAIYETCLYIEKQIVLHNENDANKWASANSVRHAYVIEAILKYAQENKKGSLKILNASGLSCGHQDIAICKYLKERRLSIDWTVFESPRNPFLQQEKLLNLIKQYSIQLNLKDFSVNENILGEETYDIVIFTEIIEHLEHNVLLRLLGEIKKRVNDNGILIITTPNITYLKNRLKFLWGNADLNYWGDGKTNLQEGLWGHIVYYDIYRLNRILDDSGFITISQSTYNYTVYAGSRHIKRALINIVTNIAKYSGESLMIIAKKGAVENSIPFRL